MKSRIPAVSALCGLCCLLPSASWAAEPRKPTVQEVFNEGKAAFFRDDYATAKRLLTRVNQADPSHRPTIIMLKNIAMAEREAAAKAASLEGRMRRTVLPRLDLVDARIPEVLEFLQIKAAEISPDGARPNFVIRLDEQDAKRPVTLRLTQPTLHAALAALATLADLEIRYDEHAVTIRSRSLVPATPAAAAATSRSPDA